MSQPAFDFTVPNAYARRGPVQARHASREGAESVAGRAETQTARYIALLQAYPEGLTDWRAAELLGVERTSVNARRSPLVKTGVVVANGFHKDDHSDVANTRWQLAAMRDGNTIRARRVGAARCDDSESRGLARDTGESAARIEPALHRDTCDHACGATSPGGENPAFDTAASAGMVTRSEGHTGNREDSAIAPSIHIAEHGEIVGRHNDGESREEQAQRVDLVQIQNAAIASPRRLTAETVRDVPYGTRVVLRDGSFAQSRLVTTKGLLGVYVHHTRQLETLAPEQLEDWRATEGELREVAP